MKVLFEFQTYCNGQSSGINNYKTKVLEGDYEKLRLIEEDAKLKGFDMIGDKDSAPLACLNFSPVNFFHAPLKGKVYVSDVIMRPSEYHHRYLTYSAVITFDESKI